MISNKKEYSWKYEFLLTLVFNYFNCFYGQMIFALIPTLARYINLTPMQAGVLSSIFGLTAMCFRPVTSVVLKKVDNKKLIVTGLMIYVFLTLIFVVVQNFYVLLISRMMQGILLCLFGTSLGATAAIVVPKELHQTKMPIFSLALPIMSFIGPVIGILLLNQFGYKVMFVVLAVMMFGMSLLYTTSKYYTPLKKDYTKYSIINIFKSSILKKALPLSLPLALNCIAHTAMVAYLPIYAREKNISNISMFFWIAVCGMLIGKKITKTLIEKINSRNLFLVAGVSVTLAIIGVFFLNGAISLFSIAILYGFGVSIYQSSLTTAILDRANQDEYGAATSTYLIAFDFGFGFGGLLLGFIYSALGSSMIFTIAVIVNIVATILGYMLLKNKVNYE